MKVHKKTYSKPLPNGAKILCRKDGKYAKYRDNKGVLQEAKLTKSGDKILCKSKLWYVGFEDNLGTRRNVKGYTDKAATQRLADNIQKLLNYKANNQPLDKDLNEFIEILPSRIRADLMSFGLLDGLMLADKTLLDYIEEFRDHLTKKERCLRHIREITGTLKRIFGECGFVTWSDIKPDGLKDYLDALRDGGRGISKRRYNGLLGSAKFFCSWMVRQRKAASSPIDYLERLDNIQTDKRHTRRVLDLDDFRKLLDATLKGPKIYGATGYERNFIYRLVIETGLRRIDLQRLRVQDCDFPGRKLKVQAGRTKNKRDTDVYLTPETTLELKQYCANKLPHASVFYITDKTSKMVRFDLTAANIEYKDADGNYFDFHSLKHQAASLFGANPDTPESVRQQLTRHKSPEMARHYTHVSEQQQRKAIDALPDLRQSSSETAVKTGTDDDFLLKSCFGTGRPVDSVDADRRLENKKPVLQPLGVSNKGTVQTTEPKVRGPSPLRRVTFLIGVTNYLFIGSFFGKLHLKG